MLFIALRQHENDIKRALLSVFLCAEQRLFSLFLASPEGKSVSAVSDRGQSRVIHTFRLKGTDVKGFTLGRERLHVLMYGRSLLCQDWIIIAIIIIRIIN